MCWGVGGCQSVNRLVSDRPADRSGRRSGGRVQPKNHSQTTTEMYLPTYLLKRRLVLEIGPPRREPPRLRVEVQAVRVRGGVGGGKV